MKRLRVLVCLIAALLCWYPSSHVLCSEHGSSGPGVFSGGSSPPERHHDHEQSLGTERKMEEESRTHTHTSYDVGLEAEKAALDEPNTHNTEQNVNQQEPVVADVWSPPERHSDPGTPAAEPHTHTDTDLQTNRRTHTHTDSEPDIQPPPLQDQGPPLSSPPPWVDEPAEGQASTDPSPAPAPCGEPLADPSPAPAQTSSEPLATHSTAPAQTSSEPLATPSPALAETPREPSADRSPAPATEAPQQTPTSELPAAAPASSIEVARSDPAVEDPPVKVASAEAGSYLEVASAGSNSSLEANVSAEHSDSQCGGIPHNLATQTPPFGSPPASGVGDPLESQTEPGQVQATPGSYADVQEPDLGQPELDQGGDTSHRHQDMDQEAQVEGQAVDSGGRETDPSVPSKEDIPTFDEWKKQVMEVEKEKTLSLHTSTSGSQPVKKVQKNFKNNYASVECGAKILSANTEAKSTSAILMENMDLYMLNPCSNKIWFVIELCEPIQVKQLDVANFELFSSTPKDFLVSISDRYPTNKWVKLGTFHARDERTVQSFPLDEQLYAKYVKMFIKYIKVELISHFGSEHFCPLSLIRVFGTSMVEEYEEIADSQYPSERLEYLEEDYDYPPGYLPSEDKGSKNLLGSATNAILNMVNNIAANVLGGKPEGGSQIEANASSQSQNETEGNKEVLLTPTPTTPPQVVETVDPDRPAPQDVQEIPSSPSTSPGPSLSEDIQIVTLVEDEEEEPPLSTVTLMEEEGDDEAGEQEEQWVRESQLYCPLPSSVPPLSPFSCVATLPELLRRWCNARLARERQNGLRKRRKGSPAETPEDTPLNIQVPVPDHTQDAPPSTDTDADTEPSLQSQNEEVPSTNQHHYTQPTDNPTLEPVIVLEPSQTSTLPTDSFSHTSLSKPTPTQEETPPASSLDDPAAALQGAPVQETQQASTLTPTPPPHPSASETASLDAPQPLLKEQPLPTASRPADIPPPTEHPVPQPDTHTEPHTARAGPDSGDLQGQGELGESSPQPTEHLRGDESVEDLLLSIPVNANGQLHRTATDFYAELQSAGEYVGGNGGLNIHSSSQKESVFMRLNNRIKALEMNMSLSSRYLEELSQRYRKQMEEMQRAFNKTIIKLQNTSRIAEEQDQRQTESIQMLQGQLENITKLMINLTVTVSQLQREVSDRQSYLVVSLFLCLCLGLLLCLQCCKTSTTHPITHTTANHYPSPKRCFSSYDDMSLKRRVACPLVRSKSFTFPTSEGPDDLYIVEPLRFSPEKKKKRCKLKTTLSAPSSPLANGGLKCNGLPHHPLLPSPPPAPLVEDASCKEFRFPSESSSSCSSSTHSEESYISRGLPLSSAPVLCNGHAPLHSKRSVKRRRSRQAELQFSSRQVVGAAVNSLPSLQQLIKGSKEIHVGTIGATVTTGDI
ncbi:SUN domain-containing ossification factor isoform X2 [Esox lucius]|uniref:SUN domain-containing ossification factor isoform X2 n=1 Tax=Esox lucius TaxID=8010 RepID=UPI001476A8E8|nr:SUN domain-containing ossification factor isoform X2 [Esox lucius]